MTPIFKKLNFKQQPEILILNAPVEFEGELEAIAQDTTVNHAIHADGEFDFLLAFVKTKADIDQITPMVREKLRADPVVWFAYPKGSSKKYRAEINRDQGWEILGQLGFEAVRQVAIDDDWSAIRFREVEFIKAMNRRQDFAMSEHGKQRTGHSSKKQ
ncbi:hypothetical protein [Parapedobacter sp. 10938]|uniref:hypothetical protein n=1 Tax=Parapedobacter flavus TaxID=3110225 RepID=UPI002DB8CFEC|nr:hypothetical protein [Parapedobacter sp. 10938]MEC3880388.1 hypothetical protein [Parapedobacter sp. 10938]